MLDFSNLVSAIHLSVQRASDSLAQASYESFGRYFVDTKEPADARAILADALREATTLSKTGKPEDVVARLASSLEAASAALDAGTRAMQPRMVAIDYPMITRDGPVVHTVHVPLITLVPVVSTQISKLTFKTDLDVQVDDRGVLQVAFASSGAGVPPSSGEGGSGGEGIGSTPARTSNASIEIIVESTPAPDGLRKVIEGYERALRAQIPG